MAETTRRRTARPRTAAQLSQAYPISIVIPAHNSAGSLPECLQALRLNDLSHAEIIVVDDASQDETADVAQRQAATAPLRLVRLESQSGPAQARNRGLEEAAFPHVLFLDSDVLLPPRSLEWVREGLDLYSHRPEVAGVLGVYAEKLPWDDFFTNYKNLYTCFLYRTTESLSPFVQTAIFCASKEILKEAGGFDGRLSTAEDFRLGIELGTRGYRFVIDRRIAGVHLKRYGLMSVLREDWRRISDLRKVQLGPSQRLFYYQAHRWSRILSVTLPPAVAALAGLSLWESRFLPAAAALLALFYIANGSLLNYFRRKRGVVFALKAAVFLLAEMSWAAMCAGRAFLASGRIAPSVAGHDAGPDYKSRSTITSSTNRP